MDAGDDGGSNSGVLEYLNHVATGQGIEPQMNADKKREVKKKFQRVPPSSVEMEQAVLGSVLYDPETIHQARDILSYWDFYQAQHQVIFKAILDLFERGEPIDTITLTEELRRTGRLEKVGGPAYISMLPDLTPTPVHISSYAKVVHDKAMLRTLISTAQEVEERAYEDPAEPENLINEANAAFRDVLSDKTRNKITHIEAIYREAYKILEAKQQGRRLGIKSGFLKFDQLTGGFHNTELTIIAARPGMGKTALLAQLADTISIEIPVLVFSLEMAAVQLANRRMSAHSGINAASIRRGHLAPEDWDHIITAVNRNQNHKIWIDDTPGQTIEGIVNKTHWAKAEHQIEIVFIDHLQIIRAPRTRNREQEISGICQDLKNLARRLCIPVVVACQLNRNLESRDDKRPRLSDLRDSGGIEENADNVAFLYRPKYYDKNLEEDAVSVNFAKQRNDCVGEVKFLFDAAHQNFTEYRKDGE